MTETQPQRLYTAFWLYSRRKEDPLWERAVESPDQAAEPFVAALEAAAPNVQVRGVYATSGLSPEVDLIVWVVGDSAESLHNLAVELNRTPLGRGLDVKRVYLGMASGSQYDPTHSPAFLQGKPPKKYLSVYPFGKTPDWFLLPFERRRELMKVHGEMGDKFPTIQTNTVSSFGIADQEWIVALEDDDPAILVDMVQYLRGAEVRRWTRVDTPIYFGLLKEPREALRTLF
jgi:chlorite dismutase